MSHLPYTEANAALIDFVVVRQFARYLRLQAKILEQDGDLGEAERLRGRAARSEADVMAGL